VLYPVAPGICLPLDAEYEETCAAIRTALGLGEDAPMPPLRPWALEVNAPAPRTKSKGKQRKKKKQAKGGDVDDKMDEDPKLPLADINRHIPFLTPEHFQPPKVPTKEELDNVLLGLRKQALLEEYLGDT
jgi:pre-mRNA-splicing factor ISY1